MTTVSPMSSCRRLFFRRPTNSGFAMATPFFSSTSERTGRGNFPRPFCSKDFDGFDREVWPRVNYVTLTQYDATYPSPFIFAPEELRQILSEVVSAAGKTQLRIAETEKYPHVTYFFNGGIERAFPGEDRKIVPSPKVATYDLKPEMSARGSDR